MKEVITLTKYGKMTKEITSLEKISAIKITCNHCKTELTLPVGRNHPIETCVSCGERFPYNQILNFLRQFSQLKERLDNDDSVKISFISKAEVL
jgi:hydrogenase maturation factor HypF (carbamoyltransferase family)